MRWTAGDQILWCYPGEARPVTVISDDDDGLAVWLALDTSLLASVLLDGSNMRSMPLEERFVAPKRYELRPWHGAGIVMLERPGRSHSLWLFRRPDQSFWGWYANLEEPLARCSWGVHTKDHVLDVWRDADGSVRWKDEDELEEVVRIGRFDEAKAAEIRAEGELAHAAMTAGASPFGADDPWLTWRPDPTWPSPTLPDVLLSTVGQLRTVSDVPSLLGP